MATLKSFYKLVDQKLQEDFWIRMQIMTCLYGSRTIGQVRREYELQMGTFRRKSGSRFCENRFWEWKKSFLDVHPVWQVYEHFSTLVFIYCAIKNTFPNQVNELVDLVVQPSLPANCYVLGKFIINEEMRPITIYIPWIHLFWRASRFFARLETDSFYFLMFTEKDLKRYFSLSRALQKFGQQKPRHDTKFKFFQSVMAHMVSISPREIRYELRPNRNLDSWRTLRRELTRNMMLTTGFILALASFITPLSLYIALTDGFYLGSMANCDPELNALYLNGTKGYLSITWTRHKMAQSAFTLMESFVYWTENGLLGFYSICLCRTLTSDLLIYCAHLRQRTKMKCLHHLGLDLLMQNYMDFFKQIRKLDIFVSSVLTITLLTWAAFLAINVSINQNYAKLPISGLVWGGLILVLTVVLCISMLQLYSHSFENFAPLCAQLARIESDRRRMKWFNVMNQYKDYRAQFTMLGFEPFTPATALTLASWSISCYFIVTSFSFL